MSGLNRVMLIGNVGQKPEIRSTQGGSRIANFSIATNERWKDRASGEQKERVEWHRIVVFNEHLVGIVELYVDKGSKLMVEGKLQTRKWTGNDNIERYSTEVVLASFGGQILLLDGAGSARPPAATPEDYSGASYTARHDDPDAAAAAARPRRDELDDEIPF
jgi:single-strand DNA-binding protein